MDEESVANIPAEVDGVETGRINQPQNLKARNGQVKPEKSNA